MAFWAMEKGIGFWVLKDEKDNSQEDGEKI